MRHSKYIKILTLFALFLLFVSRARSQVFKDHDGIRLIAYSLLIDGMVPHYSCYLKNVSSDEITVLLGRSPKETIRSRGNIVAHWIFLDEGDLTGEIIKPPLSDLVPVTLRPGEITALPGCRGDFPASERDIRISYSVDEDIRRFYDVWIGEISFDFYTTPPKEPNK